MVIAKILGFFYECALVLSTYIHIDFSFMIITIIKDVHYITFDIDPFNSK